MATRTIASPGVEIREFDLSNVAILPTGTATFLMGYANNGPTDEILQITTFEEFESIYGKPTNAAERYFYHSANQLYSSNANVYSSRIPYGNDKGDGFGSKYGALVYPIAHALSANALNYELADKTVGEFFEDGKSLPELSSLPGLSSLPELSSLSALSSLSGEYILDAIDTNYETLSPYTSSVFTTSNTISGANEIYYGKPIHIDLTKSEYLDLVEGSVTWSNTSLSSFDSLSSLGGAGMIVLNSSQTTINNQFEGYYVGITDNKNMQPGSDFDDINDIMSVNSNTSITNSSSGKYIELPEQRMNFTLSSLSNSQENSISEVMENIPPTSIYGPEFYDFVSFGVFKIRKSVFSSDVIKLDYSLQEAYTGSFDYWRTQQSETGGPDVKSYLQNQIDKSSNNIKILINDNISNKKDSTWLDTNGNPTKKIRFTTEAKKLFPIGSFSSTKITNKTIGDLPGKIDRILSKIEDPELFDLDITVEAGLGTIWTYTQLNKGKIDAGSNVTEKDTSTGDDIFDDTLDITKWVSNNGEGGSFYNTGLLELKGSANYIQSAYKTIANKFVTFASQIRKDHMFIADPLRFTCIKGSNTKTSQALQSDGQPYNFSQHIYWPMRYQFMGLNSSYAAVYNNWGKIYDSSMDNYIWLPMSGTMAYIIAFSSDTTYPWYAPAGFNRGIVNTVDDIAVYTNQKQRDQLYKISINPVAMFPNDGIAVYGQKTLLSKASAFDRINVRRLFLYLEKVCAKTLKYFVFEPNTYFTRTQVLNVLDPVFNRVKIQQGMYDYRIVCSSANNTPDVIDQNELVVDFYCSAVKAGEFIICNFYATRTGESGFTEGS